MTLKVKNIDEIEGAKQEYRRNADAQVHLLKESYVSVKEEGQKALVNNVLIPGIVAVGVFFGLRQLVKSSQSRKYGFRGVQENDGIIGQPNPYSGPGANSGEWLQTLIKIAPFVWEVGKKLYEEDNLPFIRKPHSKL